jgi:hypothetical protein
MKGISFWFLPPNGKQSTSFGAMIIRPSPKKTICIQQELNLPNTNYELVA